jgi:DNA-binding YbaB/EbfC family protein
MNLNNLMKQAQEMQKKMQEAQDEIAKLEVVGEAGGGIVKVIMNGQHVVNRVELSPAYSNEEREVLEDLIAAAFNAAGKKVEGSSKQKLAAITAGLNLPEGFGGTGGSESGS